MSTELDVSIIVPLFQKAATISRTIESIQRQSFSTFEVLVVDDGSTDDGPRIVAEFAEKDPRIHLLRRPNGGPAAARNTGLYAAKGSFITFLDADDEWEPPFLHHAVKALRCHPDCDVYASAFRIGPSGVDRWDELRAHGVCEGVWRLYPAISDRELSLCLGVIHSCSSLFRTATIRQFGGFYERGACRYGEDVYLWLQLMLHCAFVRSFDLAAWYHTDASALGLFSGCRDIPLEPIFTDPGAIRRACPAPLTNVLERWIAMHALRAIQMYAEFGDRERVQFLIQAFPSVRRYRSQIVSSVVKLLFPRLFRWLRARVTAKARILR